MIQPLDLNTFIHRTYGILLPQMPLPPEIDAIGYFEIFSQLAPILNKVAPNKEVMQAIDGIKMSIEWLREAPKMLTPEQVHNDGKALVDAYLMVNPRSRKGIDVHKGIGVIFFEFGRDAVTGEVFTLGGPGEQERHDYLVTVVGEAKLKLLGDKMGKAN